MPNFNLSVSLKDDIANAAYVRIERTRSYALARFPLTLHQIQRGVLSADNYKLVAALTAKDNPQQFTTLAVDRTPELLFDVALLPGLHRSMAFKMMLPRGVHLPRTTWLACGACTTRALKPSEATLFDPHTAGLDADARDKLVAWANAALKAHRLASLARTTVAMMISAYLPTTAHLRARWPGLATLITDRSWRDKVNTETRGMMRYGLSGADAVPEIAPKRLALAEMLITQGDILAPFEPDSSKPMAKIVWWQIGSGDLVN